MRAHYFQCNMENQMTGKMIKKKLMFKQYINPKVMIMVVHNFGNLFDHDEGESVKSASNNYLLDTTLEAQDPFYEGMKFQLHDGSCGLILLVNQHARSSRSF